MKLMVVVRSSTCHQYVHLVNLDLIMACTWGIGVKTNEDGQIEMVTFNIEVEEFGEAQQYG